MVTSYYIMKMNKKTFSMEEYYSGLHSMSLTAFSKHVKRKTRCRACLQVGDIPFTSITNPSEITEALKSFGNINIDDDDQYPTYLCNICYKFLKCAILFRKVAHRASITLRQPILNNDKSNQINSPEDSECQKESEENGIKVQCPITSLQQNMQLESDMDLSNSIDDLLFLQQAPKDDGTKVQCPICEEFLSKSSYKSHLQQHNLNLQLEKDLGNDGTTVTRPYESNLQQHKPNLIIEDEFLQQEPKDDGTKLPYPICEELPDHLRDHEYFGIYEEIIIEDENPNVIDTTSEPEDSIKVQQLHDDQNDYLGTFEDPVHLTKDFECEKEQVTKGNKVQCPTCKKVISKSSYEIHLQEHNANLSNKKKKTNDQIQQLFKTKNLWPICKICKKVLSPQYYKTHLLLHNPNPPIQYMCEICGKIFKIHSAYHNHRRRHETSHIYKCKLCPFESFNKSKLKRHMLSHGELRYLCPHCPARYVCGGTLNIHIRKKHTQPQFKCDSCDRGYFSKLNLIGHINAAHLGIKNHECSICGAAFGYRRSMLTHQRHVHKTAHLKQIFSKSTYRPITSDS